MSRVAFFLEGVAAVRLATFERSSERQQPRHNQWLPPGIRTPIDRFRAVPSVICPLCRQLTSNCLNSVYSQAISVICLPLITTVCFHESSIISPVLLGIFLAYWLVAFPAVRRRTGHLMRPIARGATCRGCGAVYSCYEGQNKGPQIPTLRRLVLSLAVWALVRTCNVLQAKEAIACFHVRRSHRVPRSARRAQACS